MQIHWAAKRGDIPAIERQLRRGVAVDAPDEEDRTPLMYACNGPALVPTLQFLFKKGANVNAVGGRVESTPLMLAAQSGNPEKVRFLLAARADPRFTTQLGYTAITNCPARKDPGHLAVLKILLEAGTNPNIVTQYGECPLRIAIASGNFPAVHVLLAHNASRDPAQMSDLMWAVALGSFEEVATRIRRGDDLAARNYWEMTPWLVALLAGNVPKAELLLDGGAHFNDTGRCGKTNLMHAVTCDHVEMTRWLLDRGADVHATDDFGHTALEVAVETGAARCVEILLKAGASIETAGGEQLITRASNIDVVRVLRNAGASIDAIDDCGYWLLKYAAETGDYRLALHLLTSGADPNTTSTGDTTLHMAVRWDDLEIVALLLKHGADPNRADVDGWTPLMSARSLECVEMLLAAGAGLDARDDIGANVIAHHRDTEIVERLRSAGGAHKQTPQALGSLVLSAAQEGNLELLEYLLANRVDINIPNAWGLTALMAAAERGHAQVVSRCLKAGADPHTADENGRTALFYAAVPEAFTAFQLAQEFGADTQNAILKSYLPDMPDGVTLPPLDFGYRPSDEVACIDLLIRAGADIDSRDVDGATPLLVACRCGRPSRVARLLELDVDAAATDKQGRSAAASAAEHHDTQQREQILALLRTAKSWPRQ